MSPLDLHNIELTFAELRKLIKKHLPDDARKVNALDLLERSYAEINPEAQLHPGTVEPPTPPKK